MLLLFCFCFFFFKQKTAYEMRISDWSSGVCSSDREDAAAPAPAQPGGHQRIEVDRKADGLFLPPIGMDDRIAAAPADLARYALAKQGKADPALIFKAVALGRVQRHADPVAQSVGENADGVQPFFDHEIGRAHV